jgi:regulator of nonsense transcripts 2
MEQFIRHLLCDVLSRKTLDNVLKMLRKLHWEDAEVSG